VLTALTIGIFFTRRLNYGIDFVGGTLIEARSTTGPAIRRDAGKARCAAPGRSLAAAVRQPGDVLIACLQTARGDAAQMKAVSGAREALAPARIPPTEVVGPSVGSELIQAGVLATVLSLVAILIYIWFRFEWQFGVGRRSRPCMAA